VSQQSTEERIQVVQAWEAWSKSKSHYAGLKQTEHNFNVLGEALLPIQNLSIAAIDEAVHRLTKEGRLEYVQQTPTEKIVYRDKPKTDAQLKKEKSDELLRVLGPRRVRDQFDLVEESEQNQKATPLTQAEKDARSAAHWPNETAQIIRLIDGYRYSRSTDVTEYRKNVLRAITAYDEDHFLVLPVVLELVNRQIAAFSDDQEHHAQAVAEAKKGLGRVNARSDPKAALAQAKKRW
jgi:hypothetical protein